MDLQLNTIFFLVVMLIFLLFVSKQFKEHLQSRDPKLSSLKWKLKPIDPSVENIELFEDTKSYTINKEKVFLCLRDRNGKYYDDNMLTYVLLHELAHMKCDEVGHTKKFYQIFDDLLQKATDMKLYNPSIPIVQDYCM